MADFLLESIATAAASDEILAVVTLLYADNKISKVAVTPAGRLVGRVENPELAARIQTLVQKQLRSGSATSLIELDDSVLAGGKLVIEVLKPRTTLIVFGGGHVGQSVALIGALLGYRILVVDDRIEFLARTRLPDPRIETLCCSYQAAPEKLAIDGNTAIVIVTRGHQYDEVCLKGIVNSDARYIGMIGSRRRVGSIFKKLKAEGISSEALERVHAPIGLGIGATSPQEIGVAILAEVIQVFSRDRGK